MKIVRISVAQVSAPEYKAATVLDLIEQLPSFMLVVHSSLNFPSLAVLNDLFSREMLDDGMSGGALWERFELSESERAELKQVLSEKYTIAFKPNGELDSIDTYSEWAGKALKFCRDAR